MAHSQPPKLTERTDTNMTSDKSLTKSRADAFPQPGKRGPKHFTDRTETSSIQSTASKKQSSFDLVPHPKSASDQDLPNYATKSDEPPYQGPCKRAGPLTTESRQAKRGKKNQDSAASKKQPRSVEDPVAELLLRLQVCKTTPNKLGAAVHIERNPTISEEYSLSHSLVVRVRSDERIEEYFRSGRNGPKFLNKMIAYGEWRDALCVVHGFEDEPLFLYGKPTWGDLLKRLYSRVHPTETSADNVKEVMGEDPEKWYDYWTIEIFLLVGDQVIQGLN